MTGPDYPSDSSEDSASGRTEELVHKARDLIDRRQPDAAVRLMERAIALEPEMAQAWNQLGRALNNLRRLPEARRALERAVGLSPGLAEAWSNLGHVCRMLDDADAAEEAFRRAVELAPDSSRTLRDLASVFLSRGESARGVALLQRAVEVDPADVVALTRLGDACLALEDYEAARTAYTRAFETDGRAVGALIGLGALQNQLGHLEAAEASLGRALALAPGDLGAVSVLADVLEIQGRNEEALALIERMDRRGLPGWVTATKIRLLAKLSRQDDAQRLLDATDLASLDPRSRSGALKVMGEIHESRGEYESAFAAFSQANRVCPGRFDPADFVRSVDALIGFFTTQTIGRLPDSGCDSQRPVFIVGMPRSGTSLVEQMLAGHSRVNPCGERTAIYRLPRRLSAGAPADNWPGCLGSIDPATLASAAREYLEEDGSTGTGATRSTDKLPANFLNLGLIERLFPRARVIYCRRDPMDTGLSCFQQDFRSPGMGFATDLGHIGLYQQGCLRLMDHWSSVLRLPIHLTQYETLVDSPEEEVRSLVEFLGLDWEPACLDFHRSDRVVRTASHEQVRKPLYRSSVGRWKHYEPWLAPLAAALEAPWPTIGEA